MKTGRMVEGKVVSVTGAGHGIGSAIAQTMAQQSTKGLFNDAGASFAGEEGDATPAQEVVSEIAMAGAMTVVRQRLRRSAAVSSLAACCAGVAVLCIWAAGAEPAQAQQYPAKPIRMVVALAAGGPTDVVGRIVAQKLGEYLGQQIVVDNRPGAGGSVAGEMVARAPADGYTLFFAANGTYAIAPNFMKLPYDVSRDLAPVALAGVSPLALMVHPSVPAKSVKEFIALAKAKPGAIHYGSSGQGSTGHLSAELLGMTANVKLTHVPYRGAAPAAIAVMSGEVEMLISGVSASHPHITAGKVRALGITSAKRVPLLPHIPAVAESLPGYDVSSWFAIMTVAGTPPALIVRLNREAVRAMSSTEVRDKLVAAGVDPQTGTAEQLAAKVRSETEKWGKVVKAAGMKVQ